MTLPVTIVTNKDGSPVSVTCDVCGFLIPFYPGREAGQYELIEHGCFPLPEPAADEAASPAPPSPDSEEQM